MGNGSSKYSSRDYDYRPFTGPVVPAPSQMTHANSYASGSTPSTYDMPRRKRRRWYRFGTGSDRRGGQDLWYSAYVSPREQQPPTPNPFSAYQRPPDRQRNPSMPVPMTAQYGSLHIPDGYIPPTVNPPVVPQDVISPTTDSEYWRRAARSQHTRHPSQSHHRRPSQSHPPVQPVNPAVMPPRPFTEPTTSTHTTSLLSSPPFKPFQSPVFSQRRPPTPPPKLLELAFPDLSRPSPEALEIIQNREKTDIHRAREEWRMRDEERERIIREKREERERLISGARTIRAPAMQTVTALVVDPTTIQQPLPPLPPKKEKKPFWKKLFQPGKSDHNKQPPQPSGPVIIPTAPQHVFPSIPAAGVVPNQSDLSSSPTLQNYGPFVQQTPAPVVTPVSPGRIYTRGVIPDSMGPRGIIPSPFLRSTTPDISPPPTAAFFSIPAAVRV